MRKSIVFKLVLGVLIISFVTFGLSALIIFYVKPVLAPNMQDWLFTLIVLALGVGWTGLLGWIVAQIIIRPLLRLTDVVDNIADGNLNVNIPEYHGKDEISRLHHSFQTMLMNLRKMISEVTDSVSVQEQGVDMLGTAIQEATEQIETISVAVEQTAASSSAQVSSAQRLLSTVEQSTTVANEISKEAEHAIHMTDTMTNNINDGEGQIRLLVDGMNHISDTGEKTLKIVLNLERQANEINQITKLVGEIADQTHLLALNASIEATHAGEHGHGFAVVAHQIRKLAADSSSAVEQITHLVQEMQTQTHTVVTETDDQVQLIRGETEKGEQTRIMLDDVISSVNEAATVMHGIVRQISAQSKQMNETFAMVTQITDAAQTISHGNTQISAAIQEQSAVMQEVAASSEQLGGEAISLKDKTVIFKLK